MRAIAVALAITACSCSHGHKLTGKDAEPPGRYRAYLKSLGMEKPAGTVEHTAMTAGDFHSFSVGTEGGGSYRAIASNRGLVAPGARPEDDWHDFIAAAAPLVIAKRIAWLESGPGKGPAKKLQLLEPHDQLPIPIDPVGWMQVSKPERKGDVFTAWYLPEGTNDPVRWQITAPAGKKATIDRSPASKLKVAGLAPGRAPAALVSPNLHERLWGLKVLKKTPDVHMVVAVGQLVEADPEPIVREQAAETLVSIADGRGAEPLRRAFLAEPDAARRKIYLDALERIPGDKASAALASLATGKLPPGVKMPPRPKGAPPPPPPPEIPPDLRLEIVKALAARNDPTTRATLEDLAAHSKDDAVRALAKSSLDQPKP